MAWNNGQNQWGQQPYNYGQPYGGYQPMRQQNSNLEWIRVPNVGDVGQVSVQAGQTAWIMTQNDNVFAVRTADNMGIVSTRFFRFSEFDPSAADQQRQASIEERLSRLEAVINGQQSFNGHFESPAAPAEPV